MFGKNGVKTCCGNFNYSIETCGKYFIDNQYIAAKSLKNAINEVMDFECSIQPKLGLNAIKVFEIKLAGDYV